MHPAIATARWAYRTAPAFWKRYSEDLKREVRRAPARPNPAAWPDTGLHAAWLGHTTVLLKVDGITILTDPVFSTRVGLNFGPMTVGIKRLVAPALASRRTAENRSDPALSRPFRPFRYPDASESWKAATRPSSPPPRRPTSCASTATPPCTRSDGVRPRRWDPPPSAPSR